MASRAALAVFLIAVALGLGGCGFTPLYAKPGVSSGLSAIHVSAPRGRVGFLLTQDLNDALARDKDAAPRWRLDMEILSTRQPLGLRADDVAERYELGITVRYILTEIATGKIAHTGDVTTEASYDAANQPYAGIAARQDTQQRVAADAARKIQLDLMAWLARTEGS